MTTRPRRRPVATVSLLLSLTTFAVPLLAQNPGKNMGQAGQYYQQNKRFKFVPGPTKKGGDVKWSVAPQGRVVIEKDEYAILENDVKIFYQDITVSCDKATYNMKTKDVVAEGHVIIDQGPTRITAEHAVYNLESKAGTFFNATGAMDPSMFFTGDKIEKVDEDTYRLTNGIFTSCDLDRPAWSFHVKEAEITLDDYAHMRDLSFRARNIPIFWTPRLIWPTKSDRSQGFLIPRIVFSSQSKAKDSTGVARKYAFGQRLELGYFIPWGDTADATIYAEPNTAGYFGAGATVRYLPSQDVKLGEVNAYTVRDPEQNKQQWKYSVKHAQENLPGGFRGVVDVEDFSDLDFFRAWDRDSRLLNLSQIYSSAYLTKNRPTYSLNILSDRRDILGFSSDPRKEAPRQRFEQLPSVQFRMYPNRIANTPFYFSLESSASHLVTEGLTIGPNANYYRGDIFPTMSMQLRTPAWFSVRPQISLRDTYYSSTLDPKATTTFPQLAVKESLNRVYGQAQLEVVGPSFSRVFNEGFGGFTKFKHVIEPRIDYTYTSNVNDQERVIRFDSVDNPLSSIAGNVVEYSLTNRLIGKEAGPNGNSREVMSLSLRQSVSLGDPFTNSTTGLTGSTLQGEGNKFTPLFASLHINPYQSITLDASTTFGNVSHQIDQTSLSANLIGTGKNSDKYLSMTWFATFRQPSPSPFGGTIDGSSQFRVNTGTSLLRDKIRGDVQINYDAKQRRFLEQRYLIGGNGSCYGVALEFRRYLVFAPEERALFSYGIAVTLKNVGTIGTH